MMEKNGNTDIDFEFTEAPEEHPLTGVPGVGVTTTACGGTPRSFWGPTREEAINRAKREVEAYRIGRGPRC